MQLSLQPDTDCMSREALLTFITNDQSLIAAGRSNVQALHHHERPQRS
jgi:hypothetical protein